MGVNVNKNDFFFAVWGWVAVQLSDWAHLASQLSSHLYQSTYNIWKQSIQGFLSHRVCVKMVEKGQI